MHNADFTMDYSMIRQIRYEFMPWIGNEVNAKFFFVL